MTITEIQDWLRYWQLSGTVNIDAIEKADDVALARKYCPAMRRAFFEPSLISNEDIWSALRDMREAA